MSVRSRVELDGRWLRIVLDRPALRNALDRAAWRELGRAVDQRDTSVRVISIEGGTHFCAGADIHELRVHIHDREWMAENHEIVQRTQRSVFEAEVPTIAAIRGACFGGGLGIATACDLRLADDTARFALTPIRLGLLYSPSDTQRLVRAVGLALASDMLLTARELDANAAERSGLVQRRCAAGEIDSQLLMLAQQLAYGPRRALAGIKRTLQAVSAVPVDKSLDALAMEAFGGEEFAAGAAAFVGKRSADFG